MALAGHLPAHKGYGEVGSRKTQKHENTGRQKHENTKRNSFCINPFKSMQILAWIQTRLKQIKIFDGKYLLFFSKSQQFITENDYVKGLRMAEEIGKMLWKELVDLENSIKFR